MKRPRFVIGMDGGGTKTAAIIADFRGNILAHHVAGASNFQIIGVDKAVRVIYSLIRECCKSADASPDEVRSMTIGLTGAGRPSDQKRMADGLRHYASSRKIKLKKVRIESDARIALEGAFKGGAGIILVAGTGSIAFGKDGEGNVHRVGGWGRILGDEGSGFFIGRYALAAVCRDLDGRSAPTLLTKMIAKKFSLKSPTDIIAAVYKNNFDIATVAPLVLEASQENDAIAQEIIQLASLELVEHVRSLVEKLRLRPEEEVRKNISLSFIGGLIANETPLSRLLRRQIEDTLPHVDIVPPMAPPVYGAVVMALS
jgi:N-acetylglucosamine kinase-like BadF-type ATPase